MSITTQFLLTLFATLDVTVGAADLCEVVHPKTGVPTICEPHPEGAPIYEDVVCCDEGQCFEQTSRGCLEGEQPYYCELGAAGPSGVVSCYFEVPSYCDLYPCPPGFQLQPQPNTMCCHAGVCWTIYSDTNECEVDDIYWCRDGVSNEDGTTTCFD